MLKTISGDKSGIISVESVLQFNDEIKEKAKRKFAQIKKAGISISDYDDCKWILTNEKNRYTIYFGLNSELLESCCKSANVDYDRFIENLKVYVALRIGTCMLETLRMTVSFIINKTIESNFYSNNKIEFNETYNATKMMYYVEFVRIVAPEKIEYIKTCASILTSIRNRNAELKKDEKRSCILNEFQSYFKYDEIIREWWGKNYPDKYFFFPLYLYWVLTTILPMRVTEFCLLPYDCIFREGELYYLIIRRSRLKGSSSIMPKIHSYTIEGDYAKYTYEIPKWLYDEIVVYKEKSRDYRRNYGLLFSVEYMYVFNERNKRKNVNKEIIFTDVMLGQLQKKFYTDIISMEYKMNIISEDELMERYKLEDGSYELFDNEIMMILPKHTRHLAMINLILRGCNPIMIKEFAGHANEAVSANYYGNITKTVRCVTKILYDKSKNREMQKKITANGSGNPLSAFINENDEFIEVDGGKCYSSRFINLDLKDCRMCGGECRNCRYFVPRYKDRNVADEDEIDKEMLFIAKMIKNKEIDDRLTEYQVRLQNLQKNIANYAARIWQEEENA